MKIDALKLLQSTHEEVQQDLVGFFTLKFPDGELETNAHDTIISSMFWEMHRRYPLTPLSIEHHVQSAIGKGRFSVKTSTELLRVIRWRIHDTYNGRPDYDPDALDKFMYETSSFVHNQTVYLTEPDVNGLDILDLIEVIDYEPIKKAHEHPEPTEACIANAYRVVKDSLMDDPGLAHNRVAKICRSKLANIAQVQQIVSWRGFSTDLSKYRFPLPIMSSYMDGMHTFYESGVESRQASVALGNSKSPLEQSEYQNRRFQLISEYVMNLHPGDCGSTQYHYFTVLGDQHNEIGERISKSDLNYIVGKNYLDDDNVLRQVKETDTHLIGRTLRMRSPGHCQHPDPYGVCDTCFGGLADNVIRTDNLGQICASYIGRIISQDLLSTKHLLISVVLGQLMITAEQMKFLGLSHDRLAFTLSERLKDKEVFLVFDSAFATNLADLNLVDDISMLVETDISELPWVGFLIDDEYHKVNLTTEGKRPSLSYAMLDHIKSHQITVDDQRRYIVPLDGYDWQEPILTMPKRSYDTSDFATQIRSIVESKKGDLKKGKDQRTYDNALNTLYRHMTSRMAMNIVNLEVLLYAFTIRTREGNDFSLSKPYTDQALGVKTEVFQHRSLSAVMVFQGQKDVMHSSWTYTHPNVMDHPFDALFLPEVLFPAKR